MTASVQLLKRRCRRLLSQQPDSHKHMTVHKGQTPDPRCPQTQRMDHEISYLVRVVHQRAVVAVVAHAVPVRVSLVSVVHVRTVVPLVEDVCGQSRERQKSTELFLLH